MNKESRERRLMKQLTRQELQEIIKPLKDQRFRDIKKDSHEILTRISRLRKNLFISGGSIVVFVLAGINIEKINLLFAQGSIENPSIIPIAISIVFIYYFLMYILSFIKINQILGLNGVRSSFLNKVANQVLVKTVDEIIASKTADDFKYSERPRVQSTRQLVSSNDNSINLSFELINDKSGKYKEMVNESSLFKKESYTRLIFNYELTPKDTNCFNRIIPFLKKMDSLNRMDYQVPLWFGWIVIVVVVGKYITVFVKHWITCNICFFC